ncbi:MAG: MerR family transcriptional regulator [Dehalobacterium sp.]
MRIGEVSRKFNLNKDTIRYYIKIGLIVPDYENNYYYFSERDIDDIKWIIKLRDMDLSLNEIHKVLSLKRVSNWVEIEDIRDYLDILKEKKIQLVAQAMKLEKIISDIDEELVKFNENEIFPHKKTGLPLYGMKYIYCPFCQVPLKIQNVDMNHEYIFNGQLSCACGYNAQIRDGIIITGNKNTSFFDKPDINRELYKEIPPHLISLYQKSYNWMINKINETIDENEIVMETHINAYYFLYKHFNLIKKNPLYIIVDKFPEMLAMYKEKSEHLSPNPDIIYIADNSMDLPLKQQSVGMFIDYFGTNEHNIYYETSLVCSLKKYFAPNGKIIGTYFSFDKNAKSNKKLKLEYPENFIHNFDYNFFQKSCEECNIKIQEKNHIGCTTESGENLAFSFHIDGENLYMDSFLACNRW